MKEIVRFQNLTESQVEDLRDFGFVVIPVVGSLYEISVKLGK